jgi:uncharacterized protein (DUF1499 family)
MTNPTASVPPRNAWAPATALALSFLISACAAPGTAPVGDADPGDTDLACMLPSNCVNSLSGSVPAPLRFEGSAAQAVAALKATLAGFPEAKIVSADGNAMAVIFSTPAGFQDRVDFRIDAPGQRIDFRSRSGFGLYDFGKNRSRMVAFVERFEKSRGR